MAPAGAVKIHILKHLTAPCDRKWCPYEGGEGQGEKERQPVYRDPKLKKAMAIAIGLIQSDMALFIHAANRFSVQP